MLAVAPYCSLDVARRWHAAQPAHSCRTLLAAIGACCKYRAGESGAEPSRPRPVEWWEMRPA